MRKNKPISKFIALKLIRTNRSYQMLGKMTLISYASILKEGTSFVENRQLLVIQITCKELLLNKTSKIHQCKKTLKLK
jgi:hypothetical protein